MRTRPFVIAASAATTARHTASDGATIVRSLHPPLAVPLRVSDALERGAALHPERTFLARRAGRGWRRLSYAEAWSGARSIAQALLDRRLSPDKPVLILSGNGIEHALLSLGCLLAEIPFAPVSPAYSGSTTDFTRLAALVSTVEPQLVFAEDGDVFAPAIAAAVPAEAEIAVVAGDPGRPPTSFAQLLATPATSAVTRAVDAVGRDTVAKVLFTSGTSGTPRGVICTHGMLGHAVASFLATFPGLWDEPPVLVDWLPWNHVLGGSIDFGIVLETGGTMFIDEGRPVPGRMEETVRNLREIAPTHHFGVPSGFERLLEPLERNPGLRKTFFSRLRVLHYAGASLPPGIRESYDRLARDTIGERVPWVTTFGSSEANGILAYGHGDDSDEAGIVGWPMPGVSIRLASTEGRLELAVSGPSVAPGYRCSGDSAAAPLLGMGGFHRTGDALSWADGSEGDERGLRFDGRLTDEFKLASGTWVRVGELRSYYLPDLRPFIRDVVIVGENRPYLAALLVPAEPDLVGNSPALERIRATMARLAENASGSARRVRRYAILGSHLSVGAGDLTDKGAVSQRGILDRHRAAAADLFADPPPDAVVSLNV